MVDPEARFRHLAACLKARGHRMTPQRVALLRLLAESDAHPSAGDLFEKIKARFETTSLATVYKTLETLKEMGEVLELRFEHDHRYDGKLPHPHPHLVCVRCSRVSDAPMELSDDQIRAVADQAGYDLVGHRFDIYGICPACRAGAPDSADPTESQSIERS